MVHPPTIASSGLTLPRQTDQSQYKPTTASGALAMSANQRVNSASESAAPSSWTASERADTEAEAMM